MVSSTRPLICLVSHVTCLFRIGFPKTLPKSLASDPSRPMSFNYTSIKGHMLLSSHINDKFVPNYVLSPGHRNRRNAVAVSPGEKLPPSQFTSHQYNNQHGYHPNLVERKMGAYSRNTLGSRFPQKCHQSQFQP